MVFVGARARLRAEVRDARGKTPGIAAYADHLVGCRALPTGTTVAAAAAARGGGEHQRQDTARHCQPAGRTPPASSAGIGASAASYRRDSPGNCWNHQFLPPPRGAGVGAPFDRTYGFLSV